MKKILTLILLLAVALSVASYVLFPDAVNDLTNDVGTMLGLCEHSHRFVFSESDTIPATCIRGGYEGRVCRCGEKEFEKLSPLGHNMEEVPSEASRVIRCLNEGCTNCLWGESNGKHDETLTFDFDEDNEAEITAKYNEVLDMIENAADYDPTLHSYAEEGDLADAFAVVDAAHTELYDLILYAVAQRQIAQVDYYCDMFNKKLEERYSYMMDYHTEVVALFYSLSRPFYDSCYREFYYYGMTEEEINAFLFDSDAVSNPQYTALKDKNSAIEVEFLALSSPDTSSRVPELYAEFVANNNAMAKLMGYDNYLEYAYENVYGREYSYKDVAKIAEYVKEHFSKIYTDTYSTYIFLMNNGSNYTAKDVEDYYSQVMYSFFENLKSNTTLNDYIDLMAFTSNPDKQISFSDEFNKLMGDGNMYRGEYEGAYVTGLAALDLPIAYFGVGYDTPSTVVHEFGHYMNEIYSGGEYEQSFDLLEMHSQGNELLYLYFLEPHLTETAFDLVETYNLLVMLDTIMAGLAVDTFEQAVYLNTYSGTNADVIMADNVITADEYDLLYKSILIDFGTSEYQTDAYWRYMTITSPCYYVSYSVSAVSVLQLYEMAHTDGFDVAKNAYLKLFTYIDEDPEMTMEEIFEYAGLLLYNDEELYVNIKNFIINN